MIFSHFVSDDSSSEEETTEDLVKQRRLLRSVFDPLQISNQAFKKKILVSQEIFLDILAEIEPSESLLILKVYAVLDVIITCAYAVGCWSSHSLKKLLESFAVERKPGA